MCNYMHQRKYIRDTQYCKLGAKVLKSFCAPLAPKFTYKKRSGGKLGCGVVDSPRTHKTVVYNLKEKFDDKFYIRMRPEERDGKWRIKADVKPREGNEKFRLGATWEIPPMCPEARRKVPGWATPTWAQVTAASVASRNNGEAMED
jgi:hypothetical protein